MTLGGLLATGFAATYRGADRPGASGGIMAKMMKTRNRATGYARFSRFCQHLVYE